MDGKGSAKNLKKLLLFLLFPAALVVAAYFLLKPSGGAQAEERIRDVSVTILQASEVAKQTNDLQDKHNVARARETLDRARSLIIENNYVQALEEANKANGFARLVLDRRTTGSTATTASVRFDEIVGDVQFRRAQDTAYSSASKATVLDIGDVVKTSPGLVAGWCFRMAW